MIATGTDVKPLECLLFMRDVKSRNYFEQMKGRGTRTLGHDDLKKVTPSATSAKTHYVIVDAIGVTQSLKTASQPLITRPSVPLKALATSLMMGNRDDDTVSSLAGRLARLNKQLDDREQERITEKSGGLALTDIVRGLFDAIDPDTIEASARQAVTGDATPEQFSQARIQLMNEAARVFTGDFIELIDGIRREKEQIIDHENLDRVLRAEWAGDTLENAKTMVTDFETWLAENRDEIEALTIYYSQPHRRQDVTYAMIRQVLEKLKEDRPTLMPKRTLTWMTTRGPVRLKT